MKKITLLAILAIMVIGMLAFAACKAKVDENAVDTTAVMDSIASDTQAVADSAAVVADDAAKVADDAAKVADKTAKK